MELRVGDIVINPAMPQWGKGEILSIFEGKAMVRFGRHGIRKMALSFLASEGSLPADGTSSPAASASRISRPSSFAQKPAPSPATKAPSLPRADRSAAASADTDQPDGLIAQVVAMMKDAQNAEALRSGRDRGPDGEALDAAERAADLEADARIKARQDRKRREDAAILRFWRDVEVFLIPEAPRSSRPAVSRGRRWETVSASLPAWSRAEELPWNHPLPTGFEAAWHIVYLGVLPKQRISDIILAQTGSAADKPEEPAAGDGCLAAVVLDFAGIPLEMSYMTAAFVPGLARCRAGKSLDGLSMDMLRLQSEFDRRARSRDEAFSGPWMQEEVERLFDLMGTEGDEARIVVRSVFFRPDPKGRRIDDVQNDLLNSFFLTDLDHLLSIAKYGFSGVFARYLSMGEPALRRDVLSASEEGRQALDEVLALDRLPRGRWPFRPEQHLLPAQLGAVAEILRGQLTAVNGPPGTGKTRLLCEVAAELVVERASRIAQCRQPYEVFAVSAGADFYPLKSSLMRGTCMVAVSSNNAAVENISRFLPSEAALSRADFPEASYFPEAAAAVNAALCTADENSSTPQPVWGLLAAVLGSAWNCEQFARSLFWGFRDTEKNITLPGMKQVLDAFRDYPAKQNARESWLKTRSAFLETARLVEKRRAELARQAAEGASAPAPPPAEPSMLSQFLELMARSKALQAVSREEDSAAHELAARLDALEDVVKKAQEEMTERGKARAQRTPLRVPGRALRDETDWQLISVWNDTELARLRSRLFLQALALHEWTIKACAREFTTNLSAVVRHLRGGIVEEADAPELWDALFFMVPVVSSTLASFSRLFSGMGHASLDWVLLDEAGQATPQSAAGALWRARQAAVIGDPQQIEPVVPQPSGLLATLRQRQEQDGIALEAWSPEGQSAQTLADRTAERGTWMDCAGRRVWTGFPLRAHHRCAEPMFSVANRIAYDCQMVQARRAFPPLRSPLGPSRWLDVIGHVADTQLVREELACLRRSMLRFLESWPVLDTPDGPREASVFVISPFRKVAWHCRTLLRSMQIAEERVRCGTIHTFQGREADIVFIVLGSAPGQAGWGSRQWASRTPNILNVALTRARAAVYVIGNVRDWRRHPFFDVLSEELPISADSSADTAETLPQPSSSGNSRGMTLSPLLKAGLRRDAWPESDTEVQDAASYWDMPSSGPREQG